MSWTTRIPSRPSQQAIGKFSSRVSIQPLYIAKPLSSRRHSRLPLLLPQHRHFNMSSMRAVLIKDGKGPIENLYIGETPKPTPGAGQVIVKVSRPFRLFPIAPQDL